MKYRILSFVKDFLAMCLNFIVLSVFYVLFSGAADVLMSVRSIICLFAFDMFMYVVRKYINNIILFSGIHIFTAFLVVWLLKTGIRETVIIAFITILLSVASFMVRLQKEEPGEDAWSPIAAASFVLVATFVLNYLKKEEYSDIFPEISLIYLTLLLLYTYIKHFVWFDFMNRKVITHMPTGNLLKAGAPCVAGITGLYAGVTAICVNEELVNRLSTWIKEKILDFLKWLGTLLPEAAKEEAKPEITLYTQPETMDFSHLVEDKEPSKILEILEKVFIYITIIVCAIALILIVYAVIITIIRKFHGVDKSEAVRLTDDYVEEREKIGKKDVKKKEKRSLLPTPSDKIRNLYIRLVKENKELYNRPDLMTAREFAALFPKEKGESAYGFAYLYEKARYSPSSITNEDVSKAKKYVTLINKG